MAWRISRNSGYGSFLFHFPELVLSLILRGLTASLGDDSWTWVEGKGVAFTPHMPHTCSGLEVEHACLASGANQALAVCLVPSDCYKTDSNPESTPFLTEGVPQILYACPGPGAYMLFGCAPHCEGEVRGICFFTQILWKSALSTN